MILIVNGFCESYTSSTDSVGPPSPQGEGNRRASLMRWSRQRRRYMIKTNIFSKDMCLGKYTYEHRECRAKRGANGCPENRRFLGIKMRMNDVHKNNRPKCLSFRARAERTGGVPENEERVFGEIVDGGTKRKLCGMRSSRFSPRTTPCRQ